MQTKAPNKSLTQAFKYLLLQLLCVSDSKDDADAASIEADRRSSSAPDLDQRPPAWSATATRTRMPPEPPWSKSTSSPGKSIPRRRAPVHRWLSAHGYPPAIPVPVRAADAAELEALIRRAFEYDPQRGGRAGRARVRLSAEMRRWTAPPAATDRARIADNFPAPCSLRDAGQHASCDLPALWAYLRDGAVTNTRCAACRGLGLRHRLSCPAALVPRRWRTRRLGSTDPLNGAALA